MNSAPHALIAALVLTIASPVVNAEQAIQADQTLPVSSSDASFEATSAIERTPLGASAITAPAQDQAAQSDPNSNWFSRTILALAAVLALIFGLRYATTKLAAKAGTLRNQLGAGGKAPQGILYVVARYPVARNQTLVLLQLHNRLILTAQSSNGFQTLAELNDPTEVAQILVKADDAKGTSAAERFRQSLQTLEQDPSMLDPNLPDPRAETNQRQGTQTNTTIVEAKPPAESNLTVKQYLKKLREAGQ